MKENNFYQNTQGILSMGYIYLIVMGILHEALFFQQLDIHILKYSSIIDVLMSPINRLSSGSGLVFSAVLIVLIFILPSFLSSSKDKSWFKKVFKKIDQGLSKEEMRSLFSQMFIVYACLGIFGFFIGSGWGRGIEVKKDLKNNEIKYDDVITFIDESKQTVEILGKNTSFLFYITKDNDRVKVSPINGNIKMIEEIED